MKGTDSKGLVSRNQGSAPWSMVEAELRVPQVWPQMAEGPKGMEMS